jgi:Zn-dependent protease with chaperone function
MSVPLLFVAALSVVTAMVSIAVGAALLVGARHVEALAPAARARLLLAAASAPILGGIVWVGALLADAELLGCHAHGCLKRDAVLSAPALALAIAALLRIGATLVRSARHVRDSAAVGRGLPTTSRTDELAVLPIAEPQAFVAGLWRPRTYVSEGLLSRFSAADLEVVLEHEQAHLRRRDPLRRLLATVLLAFHLPGIASRLGRAIVGAQEMAADADAARALADAPRVAEVLVRMARLRLRRPAFVGWVDVHLEARVRALLADAPAESGPTASSLWAAAAGALALGIAAAEPIHRGAEALFRLLAA